MFTGIIEGLGTIDTIQPAGQGKRLRIEADYALDQTKIGDSIAVNGACLTVVKTSGKTFEVDLSPETLAVSTFDKAKRGDRLNLERAMRFSDRIDGHLVSGHIDGTGVIRQREKLGNAIIVTIAVSEAISRFIIHKGSIAVDGISLTINACEPKNFSVSIIPHTAEITAIGIKQNGDRVNIETDMIGKYVERFTRGAWTHTGEKTTGSSGVTMESLAKSGFL
ncbi:MAG: riboflavin synthase [Desulfobacterales bacterium]|jgi:riboflavin synthase